MLLDCPLDLLKIFLLAFSNLKYFKLVDLNMPVLHITAAISSLVSRPLHAGLPNSSSSSKAVTSPSIRAQKYS